MSTAESRGVMMSDVTCQKIPYDTAEDARKQIKQRKFEVMVRGNPNRKGGRKMRIYSCHICGAWHLTTKKRKKYKDRAVDARRNSR